MSGRLIDVVTSDLLAKFGAGNHKPGAGSACALNGMISAQLLRTVIDLTLKSNHRKTYSKNIPQLIKIKDDIDSRIYQKLEALFDADSVQFDKVIGLRNKRNKESDPYLKKELSNEALESLETATEIPLSIAELCIDLSLHASYVFDYGFQSARGDSSVSLSYAISTTFSCLSIVELNLISLGVNNQIEKIRQRKLSVKEQYDKILIIGTQKLSILQEEADEARSFALAVAEFRIGNLGSSAKSYKDIEEIARRLQNILWVERDRIWKSENIDDPMLLLKPEVVIKKVMDYGFLLSSTLGIYEQEGEILEIAGLIDKKRKVIQVSNNLSEEVRNFTLAHELGHAILHKQSVLHRDRPLDGSSSKPRNLEEMQADKFATFFLMPEKLVRYFFTAWFKTSKFVINNDNAVVIKEGNIYALRNKCKNLRGLARLLASAEPVGGKSLAKVFNVSTETMAIRLEELKLVEF